MKKVVIIGGGPAGLSTGITLVLLKPEWKDRITILEKYRYPRHKPCGGMITPEGVKLLEKLKFKYKEGIPYDTVTLRFRDREITVKGRESGIIVKREKFDHNLAQHALDMGIEIRDNCEVLSIIEKEEHWEVDTRCGKLEGEIIVGADGIRGITRKILPLKGKIVPLLVVRTDSAEDGNPTFTFFHNKGQRGYHWTIPSVETTSKGYFYFQGRPQKNFMEGAAEHLYSPLNPHWKKGLILVGERIGVDPLLGEGIAPAIEMGMLAAREIIWSTSRGRRDFPNYYSALYSSFTGKKFRFNTLLSSLIYSRYGEKWLKMISDKKLQKDLSRLSGYGEIYRHPFIFITLLWRNISQFIFPSR